jgi:nucleoside-diphosphate-sugar epimerase
MTVQKLLIVGLGDVAQRALPKLLNGFDVTALTRTALQDCVHERLRIVPFDLDAPMWSERQLSVLRQNYDAVLWTAPPNSAVVDKNATRMYRVLSQGLVDAFWRSKRLVYISTTGVYGDCAGAWVDEQSSLNPESTRARARLLDEDEWTSLGQAMGAQTYILRAPGIYALDRLPVQSILSGSPIMCAQEDSFSNHIHADDLAGAVVHALVSANQSSLANYAPCVINVCDDTPVLMGQWFTALASALSLPAPKQITRAQMQLSISPTRWSFMRESRRISNAKLHAWGYVLKHPCAIKFVEQYQEAIQAQVLKMSRDIEVSDV